jgi:hypothetical protein
MKFSKVIIWGHLLHSHTHSYIHAAFYKAFQYLGYETYWLDNTLKNKTCMNFDNCLFLTECQVDSFLPINKNCKYILHNNDKTKFLDIIDNVVCMQVYTNDVINRDNKINEYTYLSPDNKCLYQPWATDLLPEEVDKEISNLGNQTKEKTIYWVGTIGGGQFGNINEINGFKNACLKNGINFEHKSGASDEEHKKLIQKSYLAPQISGTWQVEKGYIPCRIFKNISYGQYGITNSKKVQEIFDGQLIYNLDTYSLFNDAEKLKEKQDIKKLMQIVKEKHTYLNRINNLIELL